MGDDVQVGDLGNEHGCISFFQELRALDQACQHSSAMVDIRPWPLVAAKGLTIERGDLMHVEIIAHQGHLVGIGIIVIKKVLDLPY